MKKALIIPALTLLLACSFASGNSLLKERKYSAINKESLYGYWSLDGVTWLRITPDSIYFVDEDAPPVKYALSNDTLTWFFDGTTTQKDKIRLKNDTLFTRNEEGEAAYVRVK